MTQYRIKRIICQCHPETCTHWRYQVEILVDGQWVETGVREDSASYAKIKVENNHPDWELYEQEQS